MLHLLILCKGVVPYLHIHVLNLTYSSVLYRYSSTSFNPGCPCAPGLFCHSSTSLAVRIYLSFGLSLRPLAPQRHQTTPQGTTRHRNGILHQYATPILGSPLIHPLSRCQPSHMPGHLCCASRTICSPLTTLTNRVLPAPPSVPLLLLIRAHLVLLACSCRPLSLPPEHDNTLTKLYCSAQYLPVHQIRLPRY